MVRVMSWDGQYGLISKDGKYKVLFNKPVTPFGFQYDQFMTKPDVTDATANWVVINGSQRELTAAEKTAFSVIIDFAFPSTGGGCGGPLDDAIVDIRTNGISNILTITHCDGTNSLLHLGPAIQNTPEYHLEFKNAGLCSNMTTSTNYLNDGFAVGGLGGVGIKVNRIYLTKKAFTTGGYLNGGTYDAEANTFTVSADNVAIKAQCAWAWGFHPSWPKFSSGRPAGAANSGFIVEFFDEVTQAWVDVASKVVKHGTTASWPNSANPSWNSAEAHVTFSAPKAGKYRIAFFISSVWTTPLTADDWKYCRFWAHANGFASSQVDNYWQLTGSIKDVATAVPIPPYKP